MTQIMTQKNAAATANHTLFVGFFALLLASCICLSLGMFNDAAFAGYEIPKQVQLNPTGQWQSVPSAYSEEGKERATIVYNKMSWFAQESGLFNEAVLLEGKGEPLSKKEILDRLWAERYQVSDILYTEDGFAFAHFGQGVTAFWYISKAVKQ